MFSNDPEVCQALELSGVVTPEEFVLKVHALQATGSVQDGFVIGRMFDAFVKRNIWQLFPPNTFVADRYHANNADARAGPASSGGLPLEAKYVKFGGNLVGPSSGSIIDKDRYHGINVRAQIHYSTSDSIHGAGTSEYDLALSKAAHQLVLVYVA